jgi:hypothetical protein
MPIDIERCSPFTLATTTETAELLRLSKQIDLPRGVIDLNLPKRQQTKKYRPSLPVTATWNGRPIAEIDPAFFRARARAGLPGGEAPYSVRHALGRHMRQLAVPIEQISGWLGHVQPPTGSETTLIYSPDGPDYLAEAKRALDDFVHRLNALTKDAAVAQVSDRSRGLAAPGCFVRWA